MQRSSCSLIQEILELTPSYDLDYAHLIASLQQLRDTEIHANNRAKLKKNIDKVLAIQNAVSGVVRLMRGSHGGALTEAASPTWLFLIGDSSMRLRYRL